MEKIYASRWFHPITASVLAVSILLVYSNTFEAAFQFDDLPQIVENETLKSLGNLPSILRMSRGVTLATFALNYAIGGDNTVGYHIVNTAIHILCSIAAYFLLYSIFKATGRDESWSKRVAAFSSLFFAVHPVQTQAVTYIVQRMESLSSLFYILAVLSFVKATVATSFPKRFVLYASVVVSYILAFYSKEMAITLPAAILLYDIYFVSKGSFKDVARRLPLYAILAGLLILFALNTIKPLGGFGDVSKESAAAAGHGASVPARSVQPVPEGPSAGFGIASMKPKEYLFTEFNVLVYYITLLAVPVNQNLDYDYPVAKELFKAPKVNDGAVLNIPVLPPVVALGILLFILAVALYLFIRSRKYPGSEGRLISFFILWFFLILSPTSSFVPIIDVIYEHRLYLPSLGFFVIFVVCLEGALRRLFPYGEKKP